MRVTGEASGTGKPIQSRPQLGADPILRRYFAARTMRRRTIVVKLEVAADRWLFTIAMHKPSQSDRHLPRNQIFKSANLSHFSSRSNPRAFRKAASS
jgi:hypothetical protein